MHENDVSGIGTKNKEEKSNAQRMQRKDPLYKNSAPLRVCFKQP